MRRRSVMILIIILLFVPGASLAQKKKYYLSPHGNDAHDGLSTQTAWRSIDRMNKVDFRPGDTIFLEGGVEFNGTIRLTSNDNGSIEMPVTIISFGKEKATINAVEGTGLLAVNTSYFKLVSLRFVGKGVNVN
jgi:hypothetical protein